MMSTPSGPKDKWQKGYMAYLDTYLDQWWWSLKFKNLVSFFVILSFSEFCLEMMPSQFVSPLILIFSFIIFLTLIYVCVCVRLCGGGRGVILFYKNWKQN